MRAFADGLVDRVADELGPRRVEAAVQPQFQVVVGFVPGDLHQAITG